MPEPRWCVIYNPTAGRRRARRRLERLRTAWADRAEFRPTAEPEHAVALAREAVDEGFDTVIAAGGDGTAHEVANGVLQAGRPDVLCGFAPLGSANDYVHSLEREFGPADSQPDAGLLVDVGVVRAEGRPQRFFINSFGLGFAGEVTIASRSIGWLQGVPLYGLAALRALMSRFATPTLALRWDDGPVEREPTLLLSLLVGRREGSFVLAPDAQLADGRFDRVHALGLTRWDVLRLLPRLALHGPPAAHPKIRTGRCAKLEVESPVPLAMHADGEIVARPEDGVRRVEAEMLPRRLRVRVFR